jgi:hypothetical protein
MTTTDDKTPGPTPALLSAARLAEIRERASSATRRTDGSHDGGIAGRAMRFVDDDVPALLAHIDALAPRAVDGDALGFALFIGDMRETDNHATREAWAQMEPDPKAEYVSRALAIHAIGHAAGRGEGEAARSPIIHADFAGGLSVCSQTGETTKDVDRITCHACLARLYDVANDDADKMRGEVERLTAELAKAQAALTPRAPSTREQRVERLGKIAGELLQIGEDTVSDYVTRDREIVLPRRRARSRRRAARDGGRGRGERGQVARGERAARAGARRPHGRACGGASHDR